MESSKLLVAYYVFLVVIMIITYQGWIWDLHLLHTRLRNQYSLWCSLHACDWAHAIIICPNLWSGHSKWPTTSNLLPWCSATTTLQSLLLSDTHNRILDKCVRNFDFVYGLFGSKNDSNFLSSWSNTRWCSFRGEKLALLFSTNLNALHQNVQSSILETEHAFRGVRTWHNYIANPHLHHYSVVSLHLPRVCN